jgi:phosphatidylserine/phosphatidylglycerophosphate/cardiolipin synthase-like enzyme
MHDKFLVRYEGETPSAVLMGSANFTPEGLTCQANVVHTFESPDLAALYAARQEYLANNPTLPATREACTGWSRPVRVGGASIRAFFPPETARQSIDEVVKAVKHARSSVIFCLFSPTDKALLEALLAVGDDQKLMFGLLNSIQEPGRKKKGKVTEAQQEDQAQHPSPAAQVQAEVFHRSREDKKVVSYDLFGAKTAPRGWLPEFSTIDTSSYSTLKKAVQGAGAGTRQPPAVHIHHKFIVVDAESSNPVIFTGSANMSNNSVANNDENLLEIRDAPALAQAYFAEFMRLYEHYRARALWDWTHTTSSSSRKAGAKAEADTFVLKTSRDQWVKGAYREGTNEYFIRRELASPPR